MDRFNGKRILITGGSSGMGLAGAQRIAREGGDVIITGLNQDHLDEAAARLPAGALVLRNDAAAPDAAQDLAVRIEHLGGLDGLWLNAGYADVAAATATTAEFFDRMMAANVRGPVLQMARLGGLLKPGASVVVSASTSAYEGAAATGIYAAAKGALISLARCWATAFAAQGIRVNSLIPGPIDTRLRDFMSADARRGFEAGVLARVPLNRVGSADEAAAVALFLLSDDASYVTGSQYFVDGGLALH
ncbi:SDR family oxidoreductase [Sodalis sp. RH21]|uniref:SDR family oxidoreductase n=1 Tax=unclassified Sodalis (in: enterobacteria) TaxID=2636512 RepID=UPI0039B40DCA